MNYPEKANLGTPAFDQVFRDFLVRAKVQTYASVDPSKRTLADGGVELDFQQGNLLYRDRGAGQEYQSVVYDLRVEIDC